MKFASPIALAALVLMGLHAASPSVADDTRRYFSPEEHVTGHALDSIIGRYPRPAFQARSLNIPMLAGAPIPVDPTTGPRHYSLGEASYHGGSVVTCRTGCPREDAKGRATHDVRGGAWHAGHGARGAYR